MTDSLSVNQMNGFSVIHCYSDSPREWNTSNWRCLIPSNALNTRPDLGWKSKLIHVSGAMDFMSPVLQDWIGPADLIVYERNAIHQRALNFIKYWQGMGKPVCINLDDAYWMLPYSNPARPFWFERKQEGPDGKVVQGGATRMLEEALRLSDGLVSPNRLLLSDYAHLAPNGYYLQNYAEWDWWVSLPEHLPWETGKRWRPLDETWRDPDGDGAILLDGDGNAGTIPLRWALKASRGWEDKTVIGWGGSLSHFDSWHGSGLFEAAARVTARHPELLWLVCGSDARLAEHLPVPARNKAHQPGVPPESWPAVVRLFDVGLAPLTGIYDQRRSWIKGIEYALAGTPWVGVDGETYGDLRGQPGARLGPETADFWEESLEGVLSNLEREQAEAGAFMPEARRRFVASWNLDVFAGVYGKILTDFSDTREGLPGVYEVGGGTKNGEEETEEDVVEPLAGVYEVG